MQEEHKIYSAKEFEELRNSTTVYEAVIKWQASCQAAIKKYGNTGSCVLGAGIAIRVKPPRCRNYRRWLLIKSHEATNYQGSIIWEHGVEKIVKELQAAGIDCYYECGRMD